MSDKDQKFSDRVSGLSQILSAQEIESLGFEWPKHALIKQFLIMEGDKIDLPQTLERMQYSHARHHKLLDQMGCPGRKMPSANGSAGWPQSPYWVMLQSEEQSQLPPV